MFDLAMRKVTQQFLSASPVNKINLSDILLYLADESEGEGYQDALLFLTVDHPILTRYPVRVEYQQSFMRKVLKELEAKNIEISGRIYERHIEILQRSNGEKVFRHFILNDGSTVSIRESLSIISDGTTGLCVWQAAHVLVNYCFQNENFFRNSTVLELGCGVGLCGIAISNVCHPSNYIFSDCHPAVINTLVENLKINKGTEHCTKDTLFVPELSDKIVWSGTLKESKVAVAHLPWDEILNEKIAPLLAPDFVIASDVVYDPDLFDPLAKTLREFINVGSQVILACTERNSSTLEGFIKTLNNLWLEVEEKTVSDRQVIPVFNDSSVKVYKVSESSKHYHSIF